MARLCSFCALSRLDAVCKYSLADCSLGDSTSPSASSLPGVHMSRVSDTFEPLLWIKRKQKLELTNDS